MTRLWFLLGYNAFLAVLAGGSFLWFARLPNPSQSIHLEMFAMAWACWFAVLGFALILSYIRFIRR